MTDLTAGLTGTEAAVLLVLAAQAEPVRNPDLKLLGPALEAPARRRLAERGLLEVGTGARRALVLSLTDKGWAAAADLLESPPPPRATPQLRALFSFAAGIGRYLRRESLGLGEVATPPAAADPAAPAAAPPAPTGAPAPSDPVPQVRDAYARIAPRAGAWVSLAALRAALPAVPRERVDAALRELYVAPGVAIIGEDNQKALSAADHAAALRLGGRDLHAMRVTR